MINIYKLKAIEAALDVIEYLVRTLGPDVIEAPDIPALESPSDKIYKFAYDAIGIDVSPDDRAHDTLGCMECVSEIIRHVFPEMRFPIILSTIKGWDYFVKSPSFRRIDGPKKGAIVISVTGTGNGTVSNGHIGIVGARLSPDGSFWIMSNNSWTGKWDTAYTVKSWIKHYTKEGGMETLYFEII